MADVTEIEITAREIPKCPSCGEKYWTVKQRIERESDLKKVDGFSDLHVEEPDPLLNQQSLVIECKNCGDQFQPQGGVSAVAAWHENGGEDDYGFPPKISNEVLYRA